MKLKDFKIGDEAWFERFPRPVEGGIVDVRSKDESGFILIKSSPSWYNWQDCEAHPDRTSALMANITRGEEFEARTKKNIEMLQKQVDDERLNLRNFEARLILDRKLLVQIEFGTE